MKNVTEYILKYNGGRKNTGWHAW